MPKFYNDPWYSYTGSSSSTTSGSWYDNQYYYDHQRDLFERKRALYEQQVATYLPPAATMTEKQVKALAEGVKAEPTPLEWLHKRVNEICDSALVDVA